MKAVQHGNRFQITYRCPNYPKLINESFGSLEEANLRIAQIALARKQGTLVPPSTLFTPDKVQSLSKETITVRDLMDEYISVYGLNHWSEGTLSCNRHRIEDYIIPYIGDVLIKDITTHGLERFYRFLQEQPAVKMKGREQEENTISSSVIEKVHALLRSALNQAQRWSYLDGVNPALVVELPRCKKHQREAWTDQEVKQALRVCADIPLRLCILLAVGCSMRIGEIVALTWDCVHISDELITSDEAFLRVEKELRRCDKRSIEDLRRQGRDDIYFTFPEWKLTGSTTSLVLKTPKTESSVRDIYIPRTVAMALKDEYSRQQENIRLLADEYQNFNLVIAQNNGRPYEGKQISDKFRAMIQANNLKPVVFHSLRHSSTSIKLRLSGGDIKAVQGDTGHAQSNMVTDLYAHIMNDDRKRLAKKVESDFFSTEERRNSAPHNQPTEELIQQLRNSPAIAEKFLQVASILGLN